MGIESLFSSIQDNKVANLEAEFSQVFVNKISATHFYVDFNSIVHVMSSKVIDELNYILYKIIINDYEKDKKVISYVEKYEIILDNNNNTPELFHQKIIPKIHEIIINTVARYVIYMLKNLINPDKLKYLFIAIDGTPTMSKIIEQKRRRYMGAVMAGIKQKIFEKHKTTLEKKQYNRYLFETYKFSFNKTEISPATDLLDMLYIRLTDNEFVSELKKICPKLHDYKCSGPYVPNEGEKKIIDVLRSVYHEQAEYVIYSPDTDLTLLGLLLNSKYLTENGNNKNISFLKILRYNQQEEHYDVIDIDKLSENLYSYIQKKIKVPSPLNKDRVIQDVVFLLTVFGNDFVPKLITFDVRHDFDLIIDKYIQILDKSFELNNTYHFIINYDNTTSRKIIDQTMLYIMVEILHKDEGKNLQKSYMSANFRNYNKLKKMLDVTKDNFTEVMNIFLENLRNFNHTIANTHDINNIVKKWESKQDFINKLKRLTKINFSSNENKMSNDIFIKNYFMYYTQYHKFPKVKVSFEKYSKTVDDSYHSDILRRSLEKYPKFSVTEFDKEIYKFEHMLDEYQQKLNATSIDIGSVWVNTKTYTLKSEKISNSVKKYYEMYFGITGDLNVRNTKLQNLVREYIKGLIWVFNFYYNNLDPKYSFENADRWYYPYHRAPLLTQIYEFLKDIEYKHDIKFRVTIENEIYKYKIPRQEYFNCMEHLLYVSPINVMPNIVPEEYINFVKTSGYYPDLDKVINNILNDKNNSEIDCHSVTFLNKCILNVAEKNIIDYQQFIKRLREIKIKNERKLLVTDKPFINIYNKKDKLSRLKDYYKHKYINTKKIKYKKIYKNLKKRITETI